MELPTTITDRAVLVRFLEESTGLFADYAGAPTFHYRIGDYTVLRNGHIRVADEKADSGLIGKLKESGLIVDEKKDTGIEAEIADDVTARVNLIHMLSSKGVLINKAIIPPDDWEAAQAELKRREGFMESHGIKEIISKVGTAFFNKVYCGSRFIRRSWTGIKEPFWKCYNAEKAQGKTCKALNVKEAVLQEAVVIAWNSIVENRDQEMERWENVLYRSHRPHLPLLGCCHAGRWNFPCNCVLVVMKGR